MDKRLTFVVVLAAALALSMPGCAKPSTAGEDRIKDSFSAALSDIDSTSSNAPLDVASDASSSSASEAQAAPMAPSETSKAASSKETDSTEAIDSDIPKGNSPNSARVANMAIAAQTDQIVLVQANEDTTAAISLFEHRGSAWNCTYSSNGCVGMNGVGQAHEGSLMTPEGAFGLGFAFGNGANPGTDMDWRDVTGSSVWVDDPSSAYYNQWVESDEVIADWSSAEYLAGAPGSYKYCVFIQYNVDPVIPGAGSAFFFHCYSQAGSWGCVQTGEGDMVEYLQRLHNGAMIVIAYGDDVFGY